MKEEGTGPGVDPPWGKRVPQWQKDAEEKEGPAPRGRIKGSRHRPGA